MTSTTKTALAAAAIGAAALIGAVAFRGGEPQPQSPAHRGALDCGPGSHPNSSSEFCVPDGAPEGMEPP